MRAFWRTLVADSRLRWLGPEKGVVHLAAAAVVNAVWDLWAKVEGKPLWKLLVDLSPEELVACVDFSYISDALDEGAALELLRARATGAASVRQQLRSDGLSRVHDVGGLARLRRTRRSRRSSRARCDEGFTHVKMKVGRDLDDDVRRAALIRARSGRTGG